MMTDCWLQPFFYLARVHIFFFVIAAWKYEASWSKLIEVACISMCRGVLFRLLLHRDRKLYRDKFCIYIFCIRVL